MDPDTPVWETENTDGTFSLIPPSESIPPIGQIVKDGPLYYEYIGQASYSGQPILGGVISFVQGVDDRSTVEKTVGRRRVDALGRLWQVVDVDERELDAVIAAYELRYPERPLPPDESVSPDDEGRVGELVTVELQSWTNVGVCQGVATKRVWNGENGTLVGGSHNAWDDSAVRITSPGQCSATLIEDSHILTAAHCVVQANGSPVPVSSISFVLDEYGGTYAGSVWVNSIFVPAAYTGGPVGGSTDFDDDWAVIKLNYPIATAANTLALSGTGDATLTGLTFTRTFGTPGCFPGLTPNTALWRVTESGGPTSTTSSVVRHRVDNVAGQSGSAFYYCPGGASNSFCEAGETGFIYGVFAGFNSANMRVVGPKVPAFRPTALAFMASSPQ